MNKFFKASLLAIVFVGMSSFTTEDAVLETTCEDQAASVYFIVQAVMPLTPQESLNEIYFTYYWSCLDNGGSTDLVADPNEK